MNQQKRTIGKLSYKEVYEIQTLYRKGEPVFNIVNKYNATLDTVVDIGRGMRTTVLTKLANQFLMVGLLKQMSFVKNTNGLIKLHIN